MAFRRSHLALVSIAFAAPVALLAACSSSDADPPATSAGTGNVGNTNPGGGFNPGGGNNPGGGTNPGAGTNPGGGTNPGAGTGGTSAGTGGDMTSGTGGATAGTAGTAGVGGMLAVKDCATKTAVPTPLLTDFESYDGTVPAHGTGSWVFQVGTTAFAGLYPLSEEATPADYSLVLAAGADGSNFAATAKDPATVNWGGGVGFWMGCLDASAYTGLTFSLRGTTPLATIRVTVTTEDTSPPSATNPAAGGTCDPAPLEGCAAPGAEVPITADWTTVTIPWAMFTGGRGAAGPVVLTGDEITGMSFQAGIIYMEDPPGSMMYPPQPGSYEIAVDNLGFAQ